MKRFEVAVLLQKKLRVSYIVSCTAAVLSLVTLFILNLIKPSETLGVLVFFLVIFLVIDILFIYIYFNSKVDKGTRRMTLEQISTAVYYNTHTSSNIELSMRDFLKIFPDFSKEEQYTELIKLLSNVEVHKAMINLKDYTQNKHFYNEEIKNPFNSHGKHKGDTI